MYNNLGEPYIDNKITFYNCDCMELMRQTPDKYYELAIIDPPYGLGDTKLTQGGTWATKYKKGDCSWDVKPTQEYFKELFRVSNNWIIWGANYFSESIQGARCFIVWRKLQMLGMHTMADCELALTSFDKNAKIYDGNNDPSRIHPTQKPVRLYTWLLANYAKAGDKILDTHVGSASSLIACHQLGFEVVGCELDREYYDLAVDRIQNTTAQMSLF